MSVKALIDRFFVKDLIKECTEKLSTFAKGPEYPALVQKLIVQGLIKIEEPVVEILCRAEDKAIVSRVVSMK